VTRWIAPASLFCADRPMAPFSPDRPVEDSYADRPTRERPGKGAEQLCVSGGSLPRIGRHTLLFGRFSVSTTIRDARRSADKSSPAEEVSAPAVSCLCYQALCAWHFGQIASVRNTMRRAIALARELNDTHALAVALFHAAFLVLPRRASHGSRTASGVIAPPVRYLTLRGP
jgi:hypothetical protein